MSESNNPKMRAVMRAWVNRLPEAIRAVEAKSRNLLPDGYPKPSSWWLATQTDGRGIKAWSPNKYS